MISATRFLGNSGALNLTDYEKRSKTTISHETKWKNHGEAALLSLYAKKDAELADYIKWVGMVEIDDHRHNDFNRMDYYVEGGGENIVLVVPPTYLTVLSNQSKSC